MQLLATCLVDHFYPDVGLAVADVLERAGLAVEVPAAATGTIHVSLFRVEILNNLGHGVVVNDQEDSSAPEGQQPDPDGSAASVDVAVINSRFIGNGFSVTDRDGLRVNEGGDGDLIITVKHTVASNNGADGIEVDERGTGDVRVDMFGTELAGKSLGIVGMGIIGARMAIRALAFEMECLVYDPYIPESHVTALGG